jgi:predicted aspartyl protease
MDLSFEFTKSYNASPSVPALVINPETGQRLEVNVIVDTGAEGTVLDQSVALALGLDLHGESANLSGLAGSALAPLHDVEIVVLAEPRLSVRVKAAFIEGIGSSLGNLLGLDFFEHVDLGLSHSKRTLYLGLPD